MCDALDSLVNFFGNSGPEELGNTLTGGVPEGAASSVGSAIKGFADSANSALSSPLGNTLAKTGLTLGTAALQNGQAKKQASAFNDQIKGLVANSNNQSYNASQATPPPTAAIPGLSGSVGSIDPKATVASMNMAAPTLPSAAQASGTQSAPSAPPQTGAINLGARPLQYA